MPGPYALPVGNARISNSFDDHMARRPRPNNPGTDWAVPTGTVVHAPDPGTVIRVDMNPASQVGRNITIRHDDGAETMHYHLLDSMVRAGSRLGRLQPFARSDNSGTKSIGSHLHTSLWYQGRVLDFMKHVGEPTLAGGEDDMSAADSQALARIESLLMVPGAGYGYPQATLNDQRGATEAILNRFSTGGGYDWLPALAGLSHTTIALLNSLIEAVGAGEKVDILAELRAQEERLKATFGQEVESQFQSLGVVLRADLMTRIGDAVKDSQVEGIGEIVNRAVTESVSEVMNNVRVIVSTGTGAAVLPGA